MKSIVLCERTLVQESEGFKNLKEDKLNEGSNEKALGRKVVNGTSESKKSDHQVQNLEKDVTIYNGDKRCSKVPFREEISENDRSRRQSAVVESINRENLLSSKADLSTGIAKNSLYSENVELDYDLRINLSKENETVKNLDAQNGSLHVQAPKLSSEMNFSVEDDEAGEHIAQIIESKKSETSSQDACNDSLRKSINVDVVDERNLTRAESEENVQLLDEIVLDLDENKENEKEEKTIELDNFSGNDLANKHSSNCEIQVGKVETISGLEKESMWAENEFRKTGKDSMGTSEECHDISMSNEDSTNIIEGEKEEETHEFGSDETLISESEENLEEGMHIEVEESDHTEEEKVDEKEDEQAEYGNHFYGNGSNGAEAKLAKVDSALSRKRQIFERNDEDPSAKKKRLSEDRKVQLEDSSLYASLDTVETSSKGQFSNKSNVLKKKKKTFNEEKNAENLNASATNGDASTQKKTTGEAKFSVLEKFRGTLKTLTRSDLEELIIQKLCEVITERSNVGELRQKAQALEQDQERWKTKAQSLTKQMREMEMVMKKYMSEVQKQIKEGDTSVVTPLKVTRSVGLQVSFYSSTSKVSKPNLSQTVSLGLATSTRNNKNSSKLSLQFSQAMPNAKNKGSPPTQKSVVNHQRRPIAPKPDYNSSASNRSTVQQSLLNPSRGVQNQVQPPKIHYKPVAGTPSQQSPQQQQQEQQNGSKVIDLTEDDDRQTGSIGMLVKTPGSIRVVNHLTQPTASQNSRFAYLLPTTSASTGSSAGQNRQVLIATPTMPQPNRQIMCSMPPLLFKGGNVVQASSQPQIVNQSNKVIIPKTLRHPAPLPQRPVNQNTRPSLKLLPPRPALKISKVQTGIVLSWNMSLSPEHAPIASYQLYAYQESDSPPTTSLWKKVGDVKALPLPMACTLTQFMSGHKYHFAVRAVDLHSRIGPFSFPGTIVLV